MSDGSNRVEHVFSRSIRRRWSAQGQVSTRDELYAFVKQLRADGIPVEASAAVLEFDAGDFRRWLAGDQPLPVYEAETAERVQRSRQQIRNHETRLRRADRPAAVPVEDCDSLMRAFESTVRLRAKELVIDPPLQASGWFPLMRLLAGEGVPVEVSATILGVDVVAYRDWVSDHRMRIDSSGDR
ncbi:hypothetical protein DFR67_102226 [Williamsia limnetica]|uniref:Uncharacterized protein n=1 Tax=Williamsia limnetica TaxID=882452 RepID=A0A318RRP1_WILLI|nr:hypothetical protein [Williamsia limnetica]PYE20088.1 hypothetical protein DFR67_102226 [Williamsia limnetica]